MKHGLHVVLGALALLAGGCASPSREAPGPDAVHGSRGALDWAGAYRGVLPCADCQGIETVLVLRADGRYAAYSKYLGKGDGAVASREGRFTWNDAGGAVTLTDGARYQVGEGRLTRLDDTRAVLARVPDEGVTDRYWKLVELNGRPLPRSDREPWLILDAAAGRVSGFGGCNRFSGAFTLDTDAARLRFGQIVSTQMACIQGMAVEGEFHQVLSSVDNYTLAGDRLTLNRARMAPLARFEAVYPR